MNVDCLIGISKSIIKTHLDKGIFSDSTNYCVIRNPYDGKFSTEEEVASNSCRTPLQIGFLGRIVPSKGLHFFLREASKVPNQYIDVHVGGEGDDSYVKKFSNKYSCENVHFHGYVSPSRFLRTLDLLVVPSVWREPLGRVVFEAFAHGVPVLGSTWGGISEMITDGYNGFTFDPKKDGELLNIIGHLVTNPSFINELSQNAHKESKKYTPEKIATKYIKTFSNYV
jgi:glycosyltransferase involved in cell wall biosynthesis